VARPIALVFDANSELSAALDRRSFATISAANPREALATLEREPVRLLVLDGTVGVETVDSLLERAADCRPPVLVLAADPSDPRRAMSLAERGVFDLLPDSPSSQRIEIAVERARRQIELIDRCVARRGAEGTDDAVLVGRSGATVRLSDELATLAEDDGPVWLRGEPGSGRQAAARRLHARSARREGPFVVVACGALTRGPRDSVWSAVQRSTPGGRGPLEQARGGTLFLDGVTRLSLESQEALARALDETPRADVRIVVSSEHSPDRAVERGILLEDLAGRLGRSVVSVAPLRDRTEDVAPLAREFAARIAEVNRIADLQFSPEAIAALEGHHWPGNVRELREAVEHAAILAIDGLIRPGDLPDTIRGERAPRPAADGPAASLSKRAFRDAKREVVDAFEEAYLRDLLERHTGNVTAASQQAGMLRSALQRLLRKHGLRSAEFRRARARLRPDETTPGAEPSP
jgi:DNA-binding NtrC family response regulator